MLSLYFSMSLKPPPFQNTHSLPPRTAAVLPSRNTRTTAGFILSVPLGSSLWVPPADSGSSLLWYQSTLLALLNNCYLLVTTCLHKEWNLSGTRTMSPTYFGTSGAENSVWPVSGNSNKCWLNEQMNCIGKHVPIPRKLVVEQMSSWLLLLALVTIPHFSFACLFPKVLFLCLNICDISC